MTVHRAFPFRTVLVANRGEVARRVIRSAHALGLRCVAVYSDADRDAPFVREADEALRIGAAPPSDSYLNAPAILAAAHDSGAEALHPGYGFLSENADFARACIDAGLVFVGPSPDAIEAMADKGRAKLAMQAAGVPVIPGQAAIDLSQAATIAQSLGYPVLIKAVAGGGGRGIRSVSKPEDLGHAWLSAQAEAEAAFADSRLVVERLVADARHVEVQILGDAHGTVVHLGERDCSAQRRHQKIVEESPSPRVDASLRKAMGAAAVAAAKAVDYAGAGTVEFLLAPDRQFYFMEMNTRLQVEHPVTEMVWGLDLVSLQLQVAGGMRIDPGLGSEPPRGHAIEARIYAETPSAGFAPATGSIVCFHPPCGPGVRCDHDLADGTTIGDTYDPMLAKVIALGPTREEARWRLLEALRRTVLVGVPHNIPFLCRLLSHPRFVDGAVSTEFVESAGFELSSVLPTEMLAVAAMATAKSATHAETVYRGTMDTFRFPLESVADGRSHELSVRGVSARGPEPTSRAFEVDVGGVVHRLETREVQDHRVEIDGRAKAVCCIEADDTLWVAMDGYGAEFRRPRVHPHRSADADRSAEVRSPTVGRVVAVSTRIGDRVDIGDPLVTVEAMKIESTLSATRAGRVHALKVGVGDQVRRHQVIAVIE